MSVCADHTDVHAHDNQYIDRSNKQLTFNKAIDRKRQDHHVQDNAEHDDEGEVEILA
ncbi:MAG: hypothetical protein IPP82_06345 [Xanthomonadales bacterium]|nr:hypothetical protein [Xanthomonadales bacterium]